MNSEPFAPSPDWRVALIDPEGLAAAQTRKRPGRRLLPSLGLAYVAASLERSGNQVAVLDAGVATHQEVRRFLSHPVQLVGVTATSFTFREAVMAARLVKQRFPSVPVVLGGPHVAVDPAGSLADPAVDFALRGEGETAAPDFVEVLKRNGYAKAEVLSQVPGLVFRDQGSVRANPAAPRIKDLDSLPFPAWHLFPMRRYRQHALLTSRGCPMDCAFCAIQTIWGSQWIRRGPEHVAEELAWLTRRWGRRLVHFNDDNLAFDGRHISGLCDEMMKRRLKLNWVVQGLRADTVTPDLVRKMRRAGCHRVSLGIESVDPGVLAAIGKKETPEDMAAAVRMCQDAGIQVLGMFMIGNPDDTLETVRASIRFARETGIELPAFYQALPYPGTRLWAHAHQEGKFLNPDYLAFDHLSPEPVFETPVFPAETRRRAYAEAERFSRRRYLRYHLSFWWPGRLLRRNLFEIAHELLLVAKAVLFPWKWVRAASRRWAAGGTK